MRWIVTAWPAVATNKLYAGVNSDIKAWGGSDICTATRLRAHPNLWRFPSNKILYHSGNIIHKPSVHCWRTCQRARNGRGKQTEGVRGRGRRDRDGGWGGGGGWRETERERERESACMPVYIFVGALACICL